MKKVWIQGGGQAPLINLQDGTLNPGDGEFTVAGRILTKFILVPGTAPEVGLTGTWFQIGTMGPVFATIPIILCRDDFGYCCEANGDCDVYPGDNQISIKIGANARPEPPAAGGRDWSLGSSASMWLIMSVGG